jgi:hypothetical protein
MTRGETRQISITVTLKGTIVNLTGATLEYVAQSCEPHRRCRLDKTTTSGAIVITAPTTGVGVLTLVPADTLPFPNEDLEFDVEWSLVDASGNRSSILKGAKLFVEKTLLQTPY